MGKIKKAVIPVAGLGTRFVPATKAVPKEMLPIVDCPNILYIVKEAVEAGIEDIIFITGRHKTALEEFFDHNYELEDTLERQGKKDLLKIARDVSTMVNVISVRQKKSLGLGHAVWCAKPVVGKEPFAVLLGDEVMHGKPTVTAQLCDVYQREEKSVVAIMQVPQADVKKYGIATVEETKKARTFKMTDIVEKPDPAVSKSRWALPGRYVFSPEIFEELEKTKPSKGGEIQLTDGIASLIERQGVFAYEFEGKRYDTGDKLGFVTANIEFGLEHPEIGKDLRAYLKSLVGKL